MRTCSHPQKAMEHLQHRLSLARVIYSKKLRRRMFRVWTRAAENGRHIRQQAKHAVKRTVSDTLSVDAGWRNGTSVASFADGGPTCAVPPAPYCHAGMLSFCHHAFLRGGFIGIQSVGSGTGSDQASRGSCFVGHPPHPAPLAVSYFLGVG